MRSPVPYAFCKSVVGDIIKAPTKNKPALINFLVTYYKGEKNIIGIKKFNTFILETYGQAITQDMTKNELKARFAFLLYLQRMYPIKDTL